MPHCVLEFSDNIMDDADIPFMLEQLHHIIVETGCCEERNIKSRAYRCKRYRMGNGKERNAFAHLTLRVLEGKPPELLENLGAAVLELLEGHYGQSLQRQRCDLTVEIVEMKRSRYFKVSSTR